MPALNVTIMAGIQVIPRKIAPLKYKVRDLINEGKLKLENLDGSTEIENSSRTPKEANLEKVTMPKEKVPIAKAGSSSTTEGLKERSCESNGEEEKKAFQELA